MARKVYVSSDISIDDEIGEVAERDPLNALLWPWFLTAFDDWGRSEASQKRLKRQVFPGNSLVTDEIIEKSLTLYHNFGLIRLYEVDNKRYMCIDPEKWFKYQTHIRSEKRENDKSKYPPPPSEDDENSAQMREIARGLAEVSAVADNCIPSPSPSLSPSLITTTADEETITDIHKKVFGNLVPTGLMSDFIIKIKDKGYTDAFIIELMLETGESGNKPSIRLMESIFERWDKEKIYTRAEAKRRKDAAKVVPVNPRQKLDKQIAYNKRVMDIQSKFENQNEVPLYESYLP